MNKKLALSFYESAENSFKVAETLAKANEYNTPTIILIQHSAECYVKAMIEASTKKENIYDLYREINSQEILIKYNKVKKPENIEKPLIPHRFKLLLSVLIEQDKLSNDKYTQLSRKFYNFDHDVENIYHTYTYFRFPQDPEHTFVRKNEGDIINAWSTLQDLREITKEFLIDYKYIQDIDIREEYDLEDLADYDDD